MIGRRLARGFKVKQDHVQSQLENAYDLLNRKSYFQTLNNVVSRVQLYNKQVEYLENKEDPKKALAYLARLNQSKKYEEAIAFASK